MLISLTLLAAATLIPTEQGTVYRDTIFPILLKDGVDVLTGVDWGEPGRMADHATVAISSEKHIAVAYHTDRYDEVPSQYVSGLKQVEIALFRYNSGSQDWTHLTTELLGSIAFDPIGGQNPVKCERPDVIAVDDMFFVTWTRRYDQGLGAGYTKEPAVLECAWITWNGNSFDVHGGAYPGLGYELDRHSTTSDFFVRECAGVPDAVNFRDMEGANTLTAGVVYPHQTVFSHQTANTRRFDLRFATCTIDSSFGITMQNHDPLVSSVEFDGSTGDSAGLILPDLAPCVTPFRFWLAYEEQLDALGTPLVTEGRIRLQLWERSATGTWPSTPLASHTFGSSASNLLRRRPTVSASGSSTTGEVVSVAFNRAVVDTDGDVVYELWQYTDTAGMLRIPWGVNDVYPNTTADDVHPVPVLGSSNPFFYRLYLDRNVSPCIVIEFNPFGNPKEQTIASSSHGLRRPAVAYLEDGGNNYVPVTWEEKPSANAEFQVYLRVR